MGDAPMRDAVASGISWGEHCFFDEVLRGRSLEGNTNHITRMDVVVTVTFLAVPAGAQSFCKHR